MEKPKLIGSINCYCPSAAIYNGHRFTFNGTTLDLSTRVLAMGAKPGETIEADYGGHEQMRVYTVKATPWDDRCRIWVSR